MESGRQAIEPQFLSLALEQGVILRIGQLNKIEHEGVLREIGRYELNVEERGNMVTILKQNISSITSPARLVTQPAGNPDDEASAAAASDGPAKPNVQQEFLDKAIRDRHPVTVFLLSGQRFRATIEAYDNFTVLLHEGDRQHLYYKHAITTINR